MLRSLTLVCVAVMPALADKPVDKPAEKPEVRNLDKVSDEVPCEKAALAMLAKAAPKAHAFVAAGNDRAKSNFRRSLDCEHPVDYHLGGAVHEAIHGASVREWGVDLIQHLVSIDAPKLSVKQEPTTGRGVMFSYVPKEREDIYFEIYMKGMAPFGIGGMLDETNAYQNDLEIEIQLHLSRKAMFVRASNRDGLLRFLEFDLLYLEALVDPKTPELDDGGFPDRKATKAGTIALLEAKDNTIRAALVELFARAHATLNKSCTAIPKDRQDEMGVDDAEILARLRTHGATIKKWFPVDGPAFVADMDKGFGCKRLAKTR